MYKNKNWFKKRYLKEKLSTTQIAKVCNIGQTTICKWLKKFNILTRSRSEAIHLWQANHCNLNSKVKEFLSGELLGDGSLNNRSSYSSCFEYGSKHKEYINYISNALKSFGIKQVGHIHKVIHPKMNNCISYHYASRQYVELLPIRKHWYPEGKKIVPRDIKLTPLVCRQWYIGDGCLVHPKKGKSYIYLCTNGFTVEDVEFLIEKLNKLGFKATRQPSSNNIYISSCSVKDFLKYIGKCLVECYKYKWEVKNA